jgi:hypothetical protein
MTAAHHRTCGKRGLPLNLPDSLNQLQQQDYNEVEIVREKKRHPKMPFNLLAAIYTCCV